LKREKGKKKKRKKKGVLETDHAGCTAQTSGGLSKD
jgi:hypothetical protein